MAVSVQNPVITYTANGTTTNFAFPFHVLQDSDLDVYFDGVVQVGGFTKNDINVVTGGDVEFDIAPTSGVIVRLQRQADIDRNIDYLNGGNIVANTLDGDVDRVVQLVQDLDRLVMKQDSNGLYDTGSIRLINGVAPVDVNDYVIKTYVDSTVTSSVLNLTASDIDLLDALGNFTSSNVEDVTIELYNSTQSVTNAYNTHAANSNIHYQQSAISITESQISDLQSYSLDTHDHLGVYEPVFTKNSAFNKTFGVSAGSVCEGDDVRLSDARTPISHNHTKSEITDADWISNITGESLQSLSDVNTAMVPTEDQVLAWDDTANEWIARNRLDNDTAAVWGNITGTLSSQTDLQAALDLKSDQTSLDTHTASTANPHSVTQTQVGLGNVDNTSDLNKPISTATQTGLNGKLSLDGSTTMTGSFKSSATDHYFGVDGAGDVAFINNNSTFPRNFTFKTAASNLYGLTLSPFPLGIPHISSLLGPLILGIDTTEIIEIGATQVYPTSSVGGTDLGKGAQGWGDIYMFSQKKIIIGNGSDATDVFTGIGGGGGCIFGDITKPTQLKGISMEYESGIANAGGNIAFDFDTTVSHTVSDRLVSFKNNGAESFGVNPSGTNFYLGSNPIFTTPFDYQSFTFETGVGGSKLQFTPFTGNFNITNVTNVGLFLVNGVGFGISASENRLYPNQANMDIGDVSNGAFKNLYTNGINIHTATANGASFTTDVVDGVVTAFDFDTTNALTTSGAKLVSFKNAGVEKASIDKDGNIAVADADVGGDLVFTSVGDGLPYGEIYLKSNATETVITTAGVFVQIAEFQTNGLSNLTTPDYTNDHITIVKTGVYDVSVAISLDGAGTSPAPFACSLFINNGTTEFPNVHGSTRVSGNANEEQFLSIHGKVSLTVGDTVEVWIKNRTGTQNIIVEDCTLTLMQIGG